MTFLRLKHNPSHMPEDELIRGFVVRQRDLAAILETVRENTGASNQHLLVLGPRGMGKTTLVNRAVAEIRRDAMLNSAWYPILFDEESYAVTSTGELWFQALVHLAEQTQSRPLLAARRALQSMTGDRLRDAALARLLEFADTQGKRLLLVLENIDMIFDEQLSDDDAWDVRHTLQNEPRIAMLATSTTRLESFHDSKKPLYELFREHTLERLDLAECRTVWRLVTGAELPENQARPIQIFTGGNTRLVTILGGFARQKSFRELMDDLVGLIDENTPYFKANIEALSKESRKIFVTLADMWSPATARQVADQMRGDIRAVSAQLGRLEHQGIVEVARRVDKTMLYQVAERMYNLYRLLRSRGSARVRAVVEFIVQYYDHDGMQRFLVSLASETVQLGPERREDHVQAYCELMRRIPDLQQRDVAIRSAPEQLGEIPDIARLFRELSPTQGEEVSLDEGALRARLREMPEDVGLLVRLGRALTARGELEEALEILERALGLDNSSLDAVASMYCAWNVSPKVTPDSVVERLRGLVVRTAGEASKGCHLLLALSLARISVSDEARGMANEALERSPSNANVVIMVGMTFEALGDRSAAHEAYVHALELDPSLAHAVVLMSRLLLHDGKVDEAEGHLRRCLARQPRASEVWAVLVNMLKDVRKDLQAALDEAEKATAFNPGDLDLALLLGDVLRASGQLPAAERAFRRVVVELQSTRGMWGLVQALLAQGELVEARAAVIPRLVSGDPEAHLSVALLFSAEGDVDRCRSHLRRAIELDPQNVQSRAIAVSLYIAQRDVTALREVAEQLRAANVLHWPGLLFLCSAVLAESFVPLYPDVVEWAREMVANPPIGYADGSLLLARVLARTHAWDGVWAPLEIVLADEGLVRRELRDVIELISFAVASGHVTRVAGLLAASASAAQMEPLLVALQRLAGEATNPPQEVSEVADDIVGDIERMREALAKRHGEPAGSGHRRHRRTKKRSRVVGAA